jgi:hypothetical protein
MLMLTTHFKMIMMIIDFLMVGICKSRDVLQRSQRNSFRGATVPQHIIIGISGAHWREFEMGKR